MADNILVQLERVLISRKKKDANSSYVASLYKQGTDVILKKIAEETAEVIMATKDGNKKQIIHEMADLWFHMLVLICNENIATEEILVELKRRFNKSGLAEKKDRVQK